MGLKRVHVFTASPGTPLPNPGPDAANLIYNLETNQIEVVLNGGVTKVVTSSSAVVEDEILNTALGVSGGTYEIIVDADVDYQPVTQTSPFTFNFASSGHTVGKAKTFTIDTFTSGVTFNADFVMGESNWTSNKRNVFASWVDGNQATWISVLASRSIPDTVPPIFLTNNVSGTSTTSTTYNLRTDEDTTVYWATFTAATIPSKSAIIDGTDAIIFGTRSLTANITTSVSISGLSNNTTYYNFAYAKDSSNNESIVQSGVTFITLTADTAAPIATFNPTNESTGASISNNITITVDKTIFTTAGVAITNSNVGSVAELRSGSATGTSVSATTTISGNIITIDPVSILTPGTVYYVALLPVENQYGNESTTQFITFTTTSTDIFATAALSMTTGGTYNGVTSYTNLGNVTLDYTNSFALAMKFTTTDAEKASVQWAASIQDGSPSTREFGLFFSTTGVLTGKIGFGTTLSPVYSDYSDGSTGELKIVMIYDAVQRILFGRIGGTQVSNQSTATLGTTSYTAPLILGARNTTGTTAFPWQGTIEKAYFWNNYLLTAQDISYIESNI